MHVLTIHAGRAASLHAYRDRTEALEAAGLRKEEVMAQEIERCERPSWWILRSDDLHRGGRNRWICNRRGGCQAGG